MTSELFTRRYVTILTSGRCQVSGRGKTRDEGFSSAIRAKNEEWRDSQLVSHNTHARPIMLTWLWKWIWFLNLNCIKVYSNSLKMSNVGKFPWNWIPKDRTRVKEETEKNQRLLKTGFHDRYDRCDHSDHSDHMETTFQRSQRQRSLR